MRISEIILEKRKNQSLNPKVPAYDILLKYKDDDSIFISFTQIPKLGINPKSKYRTPIGIYSYPLKAAWEYYGLDRGISRLPFATEQPHIQIFSYKGNGIFLNNLENYSKKDLNRDLVKLNGMFKDSESKAIIKKFKQYDDLPFQILWYLTHKLSSYQSVKWNAILRKLGYDGFSDSTGTKIIHPSEPVQAVFLTGKGINHIAEIDNKSYLEINKSKEVEEKNKFKNKELDTEESIIEAGENAIANKYRNKTVEAWLLKNPYKKAILNLPKYITRCIKKRWPEAEEVLLQHNNYVYDLVTYAIVIKSRWPAAEEYIMKDPKSAVRYVEHVLKKRWPAAEEYIKTDNSSWIHYQETIQKIDPNYAVSDIDAFKKNISMSKFRIKNLNNDLYELKEEYKQKYLYYKTISNMISNPVSDADKKAIANNKENYIKIKTDTAEGLKSLRAEIKTIEKQLTQHKTDIDKWEMQLQRKERNLDYVKSMRD